MNLDSDPKNPTIVAITPLVYQEIILNIRHFSKLPRWLSLLAISLWVTTAHAQMNPVAPTIMEKAQVTKVTPSGFQSAFEGYKPYTDEKTGNWVNANDRVGKIGGWRVYAKEAREPEPAKGMPGSHMGQGGKP